MQHTPYHLRDQDVLYIGPHQQPSCRRCQSNGWGVAGFITSMVTLFFTLGLLSPIGLIISFVGLFKRPRGLAFVGFLLGLAGTLFWTGIGYAIFAGENNRVENYHEKQQSAVTLSHIDQTLREIRAFHADTGKIPDGIEGNKIAVQKKDAWDNCLRYDIFAAHVSVSSAGSDGEFGTADDIVREWQVGKVAVERVYLGSSDSSDQELDEL